MKDAMRLGCVALAVAMLGGCALGPVSAKQRAEAATDVAEDHPHPAPTYAGSALDGSMDKLYCYNNGQDTVCRRQSSP